MAGAQAEQGTSGAKRGRTPDDGESAASQLVLQMQKSGKILRRQPIGREPKREIITVAPETGKVVQLVRGGQVSAEEVARHFAKKSHIILPELIKYGLCSEVLEQDTLPHIVWTILDEIPLAALSDEFSQEDIAGTTADNLAAAIAEVLKGHAEMSLDHTLLVVERLHTSTLNHVWQEVNSRLDGLVRNGDGETEEEANKKRHYAYVFGMATNMVPLAAEYLAARLHIESARKHHYIKTILSGTLVLATRITAAILSGGLSEPAIGKAITIIGEPLFRVVGGLVADVSAPQKRFDVKATQKSEHELRMKVDSAKNWRRKNCEALEAYYRGRLWVKGLGENHPEVMVSLFRRQGDAARKAFKPSLVPGFVGEIGDSISRAYNRVAAKVTHDAVKELKLASVQQKKDKNFVLERVKRDGQALKYADKSLYDNAEIMEAALQAEYNLHQSLSILKQLERLIKYPDSPFEFADSSLLSDPKRLLHWIGLDVRVFLKLKALGLTDRKFEVDSLRANEHLAAHASPEMFADEEFALEAVRHNWANYQYAAESLKKEEQFRLKCCKIHADVILDMYPDRRFALEALQVNPEVINWLEDQYFDDPDFLVDALRVNGDCYMATDPNFSGTRAWLIAMVKYTSGEWFRLLPEDFRDDVLYAGPAIEVYPMLLQHAGPNIKKNSDLVLVAVKANPAALQYVSEELMNDASFMSRVPKTPSSDLTAYAAVSITQAGDEQEVSRTEKN